MIAMPRFAERPPSSPLTACLTRCGAVALVGMAAVAQAQPVTCHVAYAGATRAFVVKPVDHSSRPTPLLQGATLVVEVLNRLPPAPGAGVTVRTQGLWQGQAYLLHQATYLPEAPAAGPHGFTGLQVVREPTRGNELSYWCERRP